jgi:hypothetical protein
MHARTRLLVSVAIGVFSAAAIPAHIGWACRAVGRWDAAALTMDALLSRLILRNDPDGTRNDYRSPVLQP